MISWFGSKEAKNSARAKENDDFVSLSSHELRTPLSVIKWYTEMLLDEDAGPLTDEQRKYLSTIQSSNQRAIDLVRQLLNVSRLSSDTFCIVPTQVSLSEVLEEVLTPLMPSITKKNIAIHKNYAEGVSVLTDKNMCLVAVRNIISNAVGYSKEGGTITLEISQGDSPFGKGLTLLVKDTGIGIPKAEQEKIFEKMFKASNSKDSDTAGSGLGLYISKSIMDVIEGAISVTSDLDKGSTFSLFFPYSGPSSKEGTTTLD